jgi:peptide/nickel transport system substrate-binding protein
MGLQSHFQWFTQLDEKLNIQPDIANLGLFLLMQKPILLRCGHLFKKHILFGNDSTRTVNASDFEYSLNRLLDEKSLLPAVGFTKRRKLQSRK